MEKIQRAIEKAREARAALLGTLGTHPPARAREDVRPRRYNGAAGAETVGRALAKVDGGRRRQDEAWRARRVPPPAEARAPEAAGEEPAAGQPAVRVVRVSSQALSHHRVLAAGSEGAAADAFRILRTQLLARLEARHGHAVAICAASQGDGKTLIAINLAVALVRQLNKRVVLVDLDLRRPSVHRYLGLKVTWGVSDCLLGRKRLDECLVHVGGEQLLVLPQAVAVQASSELVASPAMAAVVGELRARFPDAILIFDCPPLLTTDDPLVAMGYADGCLLVVHEGKSRKAELLRAAELVGEERLLGTVLNNARWSSASSYYYG
jgi:protein-tyrosine kinase